MFGESQMTRMKSDLHKPGFGNYETCHRHTRFHCSNSEKQTNTNIFKKKNMQGNAFVICKLLTCSIRIEDKSN